MEDDILQDLNRELENVIHEGKEILDEARLTDRAQELKSDLELLIRKRPLESVLVGVATGFLLSKLVGGSK
ncbi:MAG: hypothetical protein DA446_01185 [Bacteroidetes bacterium]|jgi:ElaB/YqjD/DUF883 family membrane-anchored ribosome-binding protein|nr:hypothetical protein [Bacteroidota bacterium]PTM16415.1 MAG: hypothetical protein DA443_00990 [Bacteroidota bacterium]PTM20810.1 MAG: hypothetical protein DA446_01185 [Bacteroidota bacterium]